MKNRTRIISYGRMTMPDGPQSAGHEGSTPPDSQEDGFFPDNSVKGFGFGRDEEE